MVGEGFLYRTYDPIFLTSKSIGGKVFKNVYYDKLIKDDIEHEFYFNKEFGIIAFTQWPESTLWVLDRIE